MRNHPKSLQYFNQTDANFFIDQKNALLQQSPQQPLAQSTKRSNFFCELDIDNQYCFDNNSSQLSKKSLKVMKMIQKQTSQEMRCGKQKEQSNLSEIGGLPNFQEDISSISYVCEQNTPLDSVWSRMIKNQGESQRNYQEQLEDQELDGFEDENEQQQGDQQFREDPQPQQYDHNDHQPLRCVNHLAKIQNNHPSLNTLALLSLSSPASPTTISQPALPPKLPTYKPTSLQFKSINNYIKNYLKQKPYGIIIHPEYSTIIEEHSQLAVQGKLLRMKANSSTIRRNDKNQKINVISINGHDNFLKEVFNDEGQEHEKEDGDIDVDDKQKRFIQNNTASR